MDKKTMLWSANKTTEMESGLKRAGGTDLSRGNSVFKNLNIG